MRQLAGIALVIAALFVLPKMDGGGGGTIDPNGTADIAEQIFRAPADALRVTYSDAAIGVSGGKIKHATDLAAALEAGAAQADAMKAEIMSKLQADASNNLPDAEIEDPAAVAEWLGAASEGFGRVAQ